MPRIMEWPDAWYMVASGSFTLQSKNLMSSSPWTGRRSISGPISQLFSAKIQLTTQSFEAWVAMEGFFAEASGQSTIIRLCDFARRKPQWNLEAVRTSARWSDGTFWSDGTGWASGELPPYIVAAAAAAKGDTSIEIKGFDDFASTARVLRRGDDIEVRRNGIYDETPSLHRVIRDMPTNSDGHGRIEFRPTLRKGIAAGDMIVLTNPMGNFRLIDDSQAVVQRTPPLLGDLGFELIEAII